MSHSTCSLNLSGRLTDATLFGSGCIHLRQTAQVSMMSGKRAMTSGGRPARWSAVDMDLRLACHHLRWSLRNSRFRWIKFAVRIARKVLPTSKDTQSEGLGGPDAWSSYVRLTRGTVSGPRPGPADEDAASGGSGMSAGSSAAVGSSDARRRGSRGSCPRLGALCLSAAMVSRHSPSMYVCSSEVRGLRF